MTQAFYRDIEPEDLPIPDKQIMQLIQYILKDDAQIEVITKLISVNPALTTQILRIVNSAFFGFRQKIKNISDAVVAMGMDSLRNMVLCFAVKEALSNTEIPGFDIDSFWEDSVRRAVCSRQIAVMVDEPVQEAFTAGMLQDIGLLVLFISEPDKADRWPLLRSNLPSRRYEMEEDLFHTSHDSVGALLSKTWNLPASYVKAISLHHTEFDDSSASNSNHARDKNKLGLTEIMHLADWCDAVYTSHDKAAALSMVKTRSKRIFGLKDDNIEALLSDIPEQVQEISRALQISAAAQPDFSAIMDQANRQLVEDNISYQELTWQLQKSLKQRDEYAAKLEAELDIAREIQQSLQPDIEKIHQVCAFNIPAYQLSGDFFDYFAKKDGTICFCLGDVSGKGTSAALLMAKAISLFRCLCKVVDDISEIVQLMNNELCETAVRGMFVTFIGGWLNPDTNEIRILNVGHPPAFLIDGKSIAKIEALNPPLGVLPDVVHPVKDISIKGKRLYLYTDGFTEGRLRDRENKSVPKELGLKGFLQWIVQSSKMPLKEQMEWIHKQCIQKLERQSDDLTLMILSGE